MNPKLMQLLHDEFTLTAQSAPLEFGQPYKSEVEAMAKTKMAKQLAQLAYRNIDKRPTIEYLFSAVLILGVRVGRQLDRDEKILLEAEPENKP